MKQIYHRTSMLTVFFLISVVSAIAQRNDYVITAQGDTLFGTISEIKLTSIKFKDKGKGKPQTIYSPQVKEFMKRDDVFESKEMPHNGLPLFLERIETGTISLYRYQVYDLQSKNRPAVNILFSPGGQAKGALSLANNNGSVVRIFASKNEGPLVEVSSNRSNISSDAEQEEAFADMLSDNPEILDEYYSSIFSSMFLRSIVKKYNNSSITRR